MKEKILSVGIDIGTSTTQVIFSRFTIENTSGEYMVPRIEITNKVGIANVDLTKEQIDEEREVILSTLKNNNIPLTKSFSSFFFSFFFNTILFLHWYAKCPTYPQSLQAVAEPLAVYLFKLL